MRLSPFLSFNKNGKFEGPENFISEKKKSFRINNEIMKEDKMFTLLQRINYTLNSTTLL